MIGTSAMGWREKDAMKKAKKADPENFDKNKYIQQFRIEQSKNLPWGSKNSPHKSYFKAIKLFFGGGRELRDFLLSNGIIKIEKL